MLIVPKLQSGLIGIYLIQNKETGKFYIGSSVNVKNRLRQHKQMLNTNNHKNSRLQEDYNIYGSKAFKVKVLCRCSELELLFKEQALYSLLKKHYPTYHPGNDVSNPNKGVARPDYHATGKRTLDQWRDKALLTLNEKRKNDPIFADKFRVAGKKSMARLRANADIEAKRKHNAALAQQSPKLKAIRRQQMLDRYANGWRPNTGGSNKTAVENISTGNTFISITEAAEFANVSVTTMHKWLKGRVYKGMRIGFNKDWRLI